ncbi:cap-specific mRNA (nucleoside-2'-O-)-methyltransferase 2 isoform X3 [Hydra vulgaris]
MVNKHRRAKKKKINEVFEHHWDECFERHYPLTFLDDNAMTEEEINDFYLSMMNEKEKLNATKSLLNNIDIHIWRSHTTQTHKCGLIVSYLKSYIKAEFVTQAWAKFYTILSTFDLFSENLTVASSVHLCEAPGAFISSLNHYLQSKFYNIKFNWIGTTLNPYYEGNIHGEMIVDDRFLIETLPNWNFGTDFSGNIMCTSNMEFLIKSVGSSIDIVTADGSIDCSDDPAEQEILVAPLLLWETITALNILSMKGNFILKIFTTFEKFTICLLYFLCKCFKSVTLSKPGPSKSGNSEVYVVCKNYQKDLQSLSFQTFYQAAIQNNLLLVIKDFYLIPKSFIMCIKSYVFESCRLQVENILFKLDLFKNPNVDYKSEVNEIRHYIAQRFLDQFKIHKIENFISPLYVMTTNCKGKQSNFKPNLKKGSFDDRSVSACVYNDEKDFSLDLRSENDAFLFKWSWHKSQNQNVNYLIETETLIIGKAFLCISYSCFCNPLLLSQYYKLKNVFHNDFLKDGLKKLFWDFKFSSDLHIEIFSEIDIDLGAILPECHDVQCNSESDKLLYICHAVLKNKKESIVNILKMMQSMKSNCCCIFILNDLLLSNFWNGIYFIITQCFEEVAYVHPSMCTSFLVFRNLKSFDKISHALTCLEKVIIKLSSLTSDLDVLHVVPIYYLMKSTYREYVIQENETFIRKCLMMF